MWTASAKVLVEYAFEPDSVFFEIQALLNLENRETKFAEAGHTRKKSDWTERARIKTTVYNVSLKQKYSKVMRTVT